MHAKSDVWNHVALSMHNAPGRSNVKLGSTAIRNVEFNCFRRRTYHEHNWNIWIRCMQNSTFETSLRLASKCLNCTRSPEEMVQKLHKYDWKHKINTLKVNSDNFSKLPVTFLGENNNENQVKFAKFFNILLNFSLWLCVVQVAWHNFKRFSRLTDDDKISLVFKARKISKANDILSSSVKRENRLKLCQATWTTHSHSERFNKMLKNFANFTWFSLLFSPKKVTGSLVKLSEFTFKVFILCFQSYLCSFCTISSGLRVQFRHLLANLRKIYIHDVNIEHHKLTAH